jgi:hypothetical protein
VNFNMLTQVSMSQGIGGQSLDYLEPAFVVFNDDQGYLQVYTVNLRILFLLTIGLIPPCLAGIS